MMVFNLAWWGSLLRRRRRTADAAAAAPPQQHQQQHLLQEQEEQVAKRREDELGTVSARTGLFRELCKPGVSSPFHRCNYVLLLITMYMALLLGGAVGLPWLLLCCWPVWGLRVLSFSWWGLSTVFDIFWLPAAVRAFQQRLKQRYVKEELRRRLREQLKGLDVAAFIGKERSDNVCSDNNIGSSDSSSSSSSPSSREKTDIGKSGSGSGDGVVGGNSNGSSESWRTAAAAGEELSGKTETARKIGGETVRERKKEEHEKEAVSCEAAEAAESRESSSFCDNGGSACTEAVRHAGVAAAIAVDKETQQQEWRKKQQEKVTSVREELQQANILRQQRAAAAATAAAAANAKRLGLTTMADCRHRAGRESLSEDELEQLLREVDAKYEVDAIFAETKRVTGRQSGRAGAAGARSFHSGSSRAVAVAAVSSSPNVSPAAAATPSSSAAGCHGSHLAVSDGNHAAAASVAVATSSTAAAAEGGGSTKAKTRPAKLCSSSRVTAAAVVSCSSLSLTSSSSPPSVAAESAPSGTEPLSAAADSRVEQRSSDDSNTGQGGRPLQQESVCCSSAASGREEEGKGESRGICDVGNGSERDKRGWMYLIPWNLIFRGFLAHCQCTYLVDLLFCHAELSPLSSSIPREFLLLLHCLVRGMTVFCVFASPYCYTPYSHLLRTQQLLSALFTCTAVSFGAVGVLSAVPLFVEDLLRPLLRLLLLPETLADSDLLQLLGDARLVLPALSPSSTGSTWQMRMDFYEISQLVTLAVITAGAYAAVRLQDTDVRVAAAAKRAYATDLLALLTLQTRQQILTERGNAVGDGCGGGAPVACAAEMCVRSDAAELRGAPLEECMSGCHENAAVATGNRGDSAAEKSITAGVPIVGLEESRPSSVLGRHVANEGTTRCQEATWGIAEQSSEKSGGNGMSSEERQRQQTEGTKQRRELGLLGGRKEEKRKLSSRHHRESRKDKTCLFLTLVLAEKVVQERVYLEKSDFELLRARVVKRFLHNGAGAVVACCLLLCWTVVAFLAVSNVAVRLNTPSDVLQEREGARLVSAAVAAASLVGEKTGSTLGGVGFEEWAEEMRLLQEELRVVMNYYRKTQRQHGWLAATIELWERLGEEFTAAREEQSSRRRHQEMNPYTVLGIKPSATGADIKKAYKLLAKQLHPDLLTAVASNKPTTPAEIDAATERMRKINAAYEKLMRRHGGRGGKRST